MRFLAIPAALTVKAGTLMQVSSAPSPQQDKLEAFVALANADSGDASADSVRSLLRRLWALPWDNHHKEVFWRLALNALPTPERLHKADEVCGCGAVHGAGRAHLYHECAIVKPLWEAISAQFQGDWALPAGLQRRHLWLAQRPISQLHQGVWDLVCLAAVCAMDHARRQWCARKERGSLPGASMVDRIGRHAVANFWLNLGDICGLNMLPRRWREAVPAGHPFLSYDSETERWHVRH